MGARKVQSVWSGLRRSFHPRLRLLAEALRQVVERGDALSVLPEPLQQPNVRYPGWAPVVPSCGRFVYVTPASLLM